jgi:predicted nucleic acid-binding protein
VISYFDTSALIPLLVDEPGSEVAARLWDLSDRVVSCRLAYPEARAALAQAQRTRRITNTGHRRAVASLDALMNELDVVEIDEALATRAGELAESRSLRGYDAVHLACAECLADDDLILVAGDRQLLEAGAAIGLHTTRT